MEKNEEQEENDNEKNLSESELLTKWKTIIKSESWSLEYLEKNYLELEKSWVLYQQNPEEWLITQKQNDFLNDDGMQYDEYVFPKHLIFRLFLKYSGFTENQIFKKAVRCAKIETMQRNWPNAKIVDKNQYYSFQVDEKELITFFFEKHSKILKPIDVIVAHGHESSNQMLVYAYYLLCQFLGPGHVIYLEDYMITKEFNSFFELKPIMYELTVN